MVSPVVTESAATTTLVTASPGAGKGDDVRGEQQRLMTALQTARAALQCATCEGDKADLETEIKDIQTQIRKLQSTETRQPSPTAADPADEAATVVGQGEGQAAPTSLETERIEREAATAAAKFDIADPSTWTQDRPGNPWQPGQFLNLNA